MTNQNNAFAQASASLAAVPQEQGVVLLNEKTAEVTLAVHEYAFDVTLKAAIRVKASDQAQAIALLEAVLDAAQCNGGMWPNGDPVLFEASLAGGIDQQLVEAQEKLPQIDFDELADEEQQEWVAKARAESREELGPKEALREAKKLYENSEEAESGNVKKYSDGEVLGVDSDGHLVQWNADAEATYNSGETLEKFGVQNLSDLELQRAKGEVGKLAISASADEESLDQWMQFMEQKVPCVIYPKLKIGGFRFIVAPASSPDWWLCGFVTRAGAQEFCVRNSLEYENHEIMPTPSVKMSHKADNNPSPGM